MLGYLHHVQHGSLVRYGTPSPRVSVRVSLVLHLTLRIAVLYSLIFEIFFELLPWRVSTWSELGVMLPIGSTWCARLRWSSAEIWH